MADGSTPLNTPSRCDAAADDWAWPLVERDLWILGRLAEGGLKIAEAIERQATTAGSDDPAPVVAKGDLPSAYAQVARAVRLTVMLHAKLMQDRQAWEKEAPRAAHDDKFITQGRVQAGKLRVLKVIQRVALSQGQEAREVNRLVKEAGERLERDEIYGEVLKRPLSELIAMICQDLGLSPDWRTLAEEAWAQAEIRRGVAAPPLAKAAARWPPAAEPDRPAPHAASP